MAGGFDLSQAKAVAEVQDEGTVVHIRDLDDRPMYFGDKEERPVTITVAGRYSSHYRRAEESIRKRPFKRGKLTGEVFHDEAREKVVACTLAWDGFFDAGKPFPLTRENARALYDACPWIYDQVVEAMNEPANFSPTPSTKR